MKNLLKKATLTLALGATTLAVAAPAQAQRYDHYRGGDATGAAIVAGIAGLALGAVVASSSHHDRYRDRYYDGYRTQGQRGYYNSYNNGYGYQGNVYQTYPSYDGYYQPGYNRRGYNGYYQQGYDSYGRRYHY